MIRAELRRIGGNFARLFLGFLLGVVVVRQVLGYGIDVFNIYTLVTVGAGVSVMLRELLRRVIVPELGLHYDHDDVAFGRVYANSWVASIVGAVLGIALLAALAVSLPTFSVIPGLIEPARWFIAARMVMLLIGVVTLPLLSMLYVRQDFARANTLLLLERVADVAGALSPLLLFGAAGGQDGARALLLLGWATAVVFAAIYAVYGWRTLRLDARLWPDFNLVDGATLRRLAVLSGWSAVIVISINAFFRFDTLFINLHLGAAATAAFGIAVQLAGLMRQLTSGLVNGLDAVVVRMLRAPDGATARVGQLMRISLYLQALMSAGALALVAVALDPILKVWLGGRLTDPAVLAATHSIVIFVMAGMAARSVSEGLMLALNADGATSTYARAMFPLAMLNPLILLGVAAVAPNAVDLPLIGALFVAAMAIFGLYIVPRRARAVTGLGHGAMLATAARPFAVAAVGALIGWLIVRRLPPLGDVTRLAAYTAAIGLPLALDALWFVRGLRRGATARG